MTALGGNLSIAYPGVITNSTDQSIIIGFNIGVILHFFLSLPLNSYGLWLVITGIGISKGFFSVHLILSEIILSIGALLFPVSYYLQVTALQNAAYFFLGIMGTGRPLFHACVCVERYLAVMHPILFLKYKPLRYRVAWSTVVWLCIFSLCVIPVYNTSILLTLWCSAGLPLFPVLVFCSLATLRGLKQAGPGDGVSRRKGNQAKTKAFHLTIAFLVGITLGYMSLVFLVGFSSLSTYEHNDAQRIYILYVMTTGLGMPLGLILEKKGLCF